MYQQIKQACVLACFHVLTLHTGASSAASPPPAAEAKASAPAPVDASISRITNLTREAKVVELEKRIRDAKASSATAPILPQGAPGTIPPIGFGFNTQMAPQMVPSKPVAQQPSVQSITTIGGTTTAVSGDGRTLAVGTTVMLGTTAWKVKGISNFGVTFEKCIKTKCTTTTVPVGG